MKKRSLYDKLNSSVAAETVHAKDKFENADLVLAMAKVRDQRLHGAASSASAQASQDHAAPSPKAEVNTQSDPDRETDYVVLSLPIEKVRDHPRNARHIYDPERVDEMATSIARDGQRVPAVVMPDPGQLGSYLLIEGRYRKRALQSLGRDTILASVIEPLSDLEAYRLSLLLNEERNDQTILDNALAWRSMLDDGTYRSQDHIAEHLNIKQGTVSKTLAILELPPNVLSIVKSRPGNFGIRVAQELRQLSKLLPERTLETIAEQVIGDRLSVRDLERMRERKEHEPLTRERSRAYPLQWGKTRLGSIREFNDGRVKIDLANAPEELRAKLISAVKKVLAETPAEIAAQSGD